MLRLDGVSLSYSSERVAGTSWRDEVLRWVRPIEAARRAGRTPIRSIDGVSLRIGAGERVLLLGPNGSGKTSLCRVIAGMLPPDAGSVQAAARVFPVFGAPAWAFPELSALENLEVLARAYGFDARTARWIAARSAEMALVGDAGRRAARELSRGMGSRLWLSVVRAMRAQIPVVEPVLWILDEIAGGEDEAYFREWLRAFDPPEREDRDAIVWVTHQPERWAGARLTRAIVLESGCLAYDGTAELGVAAYRASLTEGNQTARIPAWNRSTQSAPASTPAGTPAPGPSSSSS